MPIEFGDVLNYQIFIDGETGPIGWSGIQTVSTLLDDDIYEENTKQTKPMTFTGTIHMPKKFRNQLFFRWKASGPYRKRLIKKMMLAFPWHNFTFEWRNTEI